MIADKNTLRPMSDNEKRVLRLLPVGAENRKRGRDLADLVGVDIRTFKKIINRLIIRYHIPIVANRTLVSGYYIPKDNTERLEGIRELNAQYHNELTRLNVIVNADLKEHEKYLQGGEDEVIA